VKGVVPGSLTSLLEDEHGIFIAGETEFVERLIYGMSPRFSFPGARAEHKTNNRARYPYPV
jgi:hypothetical protein